MRKSRIKQMMKQTATLLFAMVVTLTAKAENAEQTMCVVIYESHQTTAFDIGAKPVVAFAGDDVKLTCGELTVLYPLDNYLKMTIEKATPTVDPASDISDTGKPGMTFRMTDKDITAYGCSRLALYSIDGKCLSEGTAYSNGTMTLSTSQLSAGVYIIVTNNHSFKINKK